MSDGIRIASQESEGVHSPVDFFLPGGLAPCLSGRISMQYLEEVL
jgi:hypothetical protein